MSDYRDNRFPTEPHVVTLGRTACVFGENGVLHDATPEQEAALRADGRRRRRFVEVETLGKSPVEAEPVVGRSFVEAATGTPHEDDEP